MSNTRCGQNTKNRARVQNRSRRYIYTWQADGGQEAKEGTGGTVDPKEKKKERKLSGHAQDLLAANPQLLAEELLCTKETQSTGTSSSGSLVLRGSDSDYLQDQLGFRPHPGFACFLHLGSTVLPEWCLRAHAHSPGRLHMRMHLHRCVVAKSHSAAESAHWHLGPGWEPHPCPNA